jgi:hypothetical protein
MLDFLKYFDKEININGVTYKSGAEALQNINNFNGKVTIEYNVSTKASEVKKQPNNANKNEVIYKIKVRKYMTDAEFNFHDKWNNGLPMPMRIMVGKILEETPGMYKMKLSARVLDNQSVCMRCGRSLSNNVSKYFGIGPECGGHGYNNPFNSPQELKQAIDEMDKKLRQIEWEGWVIKKAIEEKEVFENE